MSDRPPDPDEATISSIEQQLHLAGWLVMDVKALAEWRFEARDRFYHQAVMFFGLSIFNWILAEFQGGWARWFSIVGFCVAFPMMFVSEFKARLINRQLKRRAAEQIARDMVGLKG